MDLVIDKSEVYKSLGYDASVHELSDDMIRLIDDGIDKVRATATPRMVYSGEIEIVDDGNITLHNMNLVGTDIRAHLKDCDKAILMAVTLGSDIDRLLNMTSLMDMTLSVIMEAAANVAVEYLADEVEAEIRRKYPRYITSRYSPGYGDLPLDVQHDLLGILDAERKVGITLTPTNMMVPRKSITAILGSSNVPVTGKRAGCNHCVMRDNCEYRRRGKTCGE